MRKREVLLLLGMGLALFALTATLINVALLPYACTVMGYPRLLMLAVFVLTASGIFALAYSLQRMEEAWLERAARVTRPAFIIVLFVCHLFMGYYMEYTPMGDNFMLYDGSYTLASLGDFGGLDFDLYLSRFSNQWGFMLMLTAFNKLLLALGMKNRFYALVMVQAALYAAAMNCLLSMARRLRGVRGELAMTVLLAICLPLYLAAAVLYTDTFSLPFVLFTLYFALKVAGQKDIRVSLKYALLCGLCACLGCQIKMTVAIVLIAAVIVWMLTMRPARAVAAAALSAAIVIGGTQGVQKIMTTFVLDPSMVEQHNTPAIHWVMMSIPTPHNPYGGLTGDYGITWGMQEAGASRKEVMDSIYTRMKDRIYTLRYPQRLVPAMLRKNAASQGDGSFGMTEMLDDGPIRENVISSVVLEGRPLYKVYLALTSGIWYAMIAYASLSVYADMRRRDFTCAIPVIAVLGIQLFLLLWEARQRYIFGYVPLVLLLAAGYVSRPSLCLDAVREGWLWRRISAKW